MTQREWYASGGVSEAVLPPPGSPAPAPLAALAATAARPVLLWEDYYRSASPSQQAELLSLASRQGVVYSHQLPATSNGNTSDRNRQFLSRLLAGQIEDWAPLRTDLIDILDANLDAAQREAVACALDTPDIALIQGWPGTGKSRVVAEIVTQATSRGDRVLLLAPSSAALDRVLDQVGDRDAVFAIRCLGREERLAELPAAIGAMTFGERLRLLREQASQHARQELEAAERVCTQRRQDEDKLVRLQELAESWQQIQRKIDTLRQRQAEVPAQVEQEATLAETDATSALAAMLAASTQARKQSQARLDTDLAGIETQLAAERQALAQVDSEIEAVRVFVDARQNMRLWTSAWWQATFQGHTAAELSALEARRNQTQENLTRLDEQARQLNQERAQALQTFESERSRLLAAEIAARQADLETQLAALLSEQKVLGDKWQQLTHELQPESLRPQAKTDEALAAARAAWCEQLQHDEERWDFAQQWASFLEKTGDTLPHRLMAHANLVAATTASLAADPQFGEGTPHGTNFDLLVLEEAHEVTESEFLHLARRARRWVLVGEPDNEVAACTPPDPGPSRRRGVTTARPTSLRPGFFQRLWQQLHSDIWVREPDRLCCRLRPIPPEQRRFLEKEPVVDRPDIELRILARPQMQPVLAEVAFPAAMTLFQAKEYIFKELNELPLRTFGRNLRWIEEADRLVLRLADPPASNPVPVVLEPGVREMVGTLTPGSNGSAPALLGCHTCCIEFERSAGWHRERAETWVRQHLGQHDLGRTARLDVPHRMQHDLAEFLGDLLFVSKGPAPPDVWIPPAASREGAVPLRVAAMAVEFVPVPALPAEASRRRGEGDPRRVADNRRPPKGGAGLELDLSDPRHADRLPSELRPLLPNRGLVNYLEAQAVVRTLENLASDPNLPALALDRGANGRSPSLGVMALYPAQVELLRHLIQRSPKLARANLDLCVGVPSVFRQKECHIALLSLTRSHSHRAVPYGDHPRFLTLALTRARAKLIVFGDAGTLARRTQWEGVLDHLDETSGARERTILTHLMSYVQGHGAHRRAFHLREGNSA